MAATPEVTDTTFDADVMKSDLPVLVDFWAPWCGPCRMVAPIVEELGEEYAGRVNFYKMNTDENPADPLAVRHPQHPLAPDLQERRAEGHDRGFPPEERSEEAPRGGDRLASAKWRRRTVSPGSGGMSAETTRGVRHRRHRRWRSGPDGGAVWRARAGRRTVVFERLITGGQIATTELVENYPGLPPGGQRGRLRHEPRAEQVEPLRRGTPLRGRAVRSRPGPAVRSGLRRAKGVCEAHAVIATAGADYNKLGAYLARAEFIGQRSELLRHVRRRLLPERRRGRGGRGRRGLR